MKLIKMAIILSILHSIPVFAQSQSLAEDKAQVISVMKKFGDAVACGYEFISMINIKSSQDREQSEYYVLWGGDVGCAGGNASYTKNITSVQRDRWIADFTVSLYPVLEDKVYYNLNVRFIESIKKINENHIEIISLVHDDIDGLHSPSRKTKFTLKRSPDSDSKWKIVREDLIKIQK